MKISRKLKITIATLPLIFLGAYLCSELWTRMNVRDAISKQMTLKEILVEENGKSNLSYLITKSDVLYESQLKYGEEIFNVDLTEVAKKLTKEIPWIKDVKIVVRVPSTIKITYEAHNAKALTIKDKKLWVVSSTGTLIAPASLIREQIQRKTVSPQDGNVSSAVQKVDVTKLHVVDYPIMHDFKEYQVPMQWLESLERDASGKILFVHELKKLKNDSVETLVEVAYKNISVKLTVYSWSQVDTLALKRLSKVLDYLVTHNITAASVDMRINKKIIVSQEKTT